MPSISYQYLCLIRPHKINKSTLDIYKDQLHANLVADVDALKPALQHSFNRHIEKPNPIAFGGGSRNHSIKLLTYPRFKQERSCGFSDLPFDFVGSILLFCALSRKIIPVS